MRALEVRVGSVQVGLLEHFDEWTYRFSFDQSWLRDPLRPVLGQFFEDRRPHEIESAGHVPCWFLHLLPQGPLLRAIARQAGVEPDDSSDLLAFLGQDLPGAVVLVPGTPRLAREAAPRVLLALEPAQQLRFSLAGAQWKLSVREGERGLTVPVQGETGAWIAKFHDPIFKDLPRIEVATSRWAELSGVHVPPFRSAHVSEFAELPEGTPTGDDTVFLIERFDRSTAGERIHIEDFAQVIDRPPGPCQYDGDYEYMAAILGYIAPLPWLEQERVRIEEHMARVPLGQ